MINSSKLQILPFLIELKASKRIMMIINGSYDVAGLYLYMLVVETFSADKIKLQAYAFIGWGKYYFQLHIFSVA